MVKQWLSKSRQRIKILKIIQRFDKDKLRQSLLKLKVALAQEKDETVHMLNTYKAHTVGQASKADLKLAHQQLADILKGVGLGVFAVLPFSPVTIPLLLKLGKRFGVELLPSSFIVDNNKNQTNNTPQP